MAAEQRVVSARVDMEIGRALDAEAARCGCKRQDVLRRFIREGLGILAPAVETVCEAAAVLGMHPSTIRRMAHGGRLTVARWPGQLLVTAESVERVRIRRLGELRP